jgi:hypothetical protein
MPVHEVAETMFPVDVQVLLGRGSDASGRRRVTVPPMHPTGRQHVPIGSRTLTEDMGGALCDAGSASARTRP